MARNEEKYSKTLKLIKGEDSNNEEIILIDALEFLPVTTAKLEGGV